MASGLDRQLPALLPVRSSQKPASEPLSRGLPPSQVADLSSPHGLLQLRRLGRGPPAPFSLPLWGAPPSSLGSSTLSTARPDLLLRLQPPTLPPLGPPSLPQAQSLLLSFFIPAFPGYRLLDPRGSPFSKPQVQTPSALNPGETYALFPGTPSQTHSRPLWARALLPHPGPPPSRIQPALSPEPTVSEVRTLRVRLPRSGTLGLRPPGFLRPKHPSIAHCPPNSGVRSRASHPQEPLSPV